MKASISESADSQPTNEEITIGLGAAEIKEVARRQLVASIAVAIVIALGVGFAMVMPASQYAQVAQHKIAPVRQPTLVVPLTARVVPAKAHQVEIP